jgi:hypothetical protein
MPVQHGAADLENRSAPEAQARQGSDEDGEGAYLWYVTEPGEEGDTVSHRGSGSG